MNAIVSHGTWYPRDTRHDPDLLAGPHVQHGLHGRRHGVFFAASAWSCLGLRHQGAHDSSTLNQDRIEVLDARGPLQADEEDVDACRGRREAARGGGVRAAKVVVQVWEHQIFPIVGIRVLNSPRIEAHSPCCII